jgi:hypothetical protein
MNVLESVIGLGPQGPFNLGESFVVKKELTGTVKKEGMFFGTRLIVPSSIARFFTIDSILSDEKEQLAVPVCPIPAVAFSTDAFGVRLEFDPAADHITLHVTRNTVKPHSWLVRLVRRWLGFPHDPAKPEFSAAIIGEIVPHAEVEARRKAPHLAPSMVPASHPSSSAEEIIQ